MVILYMNTLLNRSIEVCDSNIQSTFHTDKLILYMHHIEKDVLKKDFD